MKNNDRNTTMFLRVEKALIRKLVFSKSSTNIIKSFRLFFKSNYTSVLKKVDAPTFMTQAITKVPNINKINFQILKKILE